MVKDQSHVEMCRSIIGSPPRLERALGDVSTSSCDVWARGWAGLARNGFGRVIHDRSSCWEVERSHRLSKMCPLGSGESKEPFRVEMTQLD